MDGRTPAVPTAHGRVRGVVQHVQAIQDDQHAQWPVAAFRGVPFAAPPVGPLRFAAPRPHPGWTKVRDVVSVGTQVPQIPQRNQRVTGSAAVRSDEHECLNLTLWTPREALSDGRPRPVLLWFHGGGFVAGTGNSRWYDGARLAALGDFVVVTANYRLGPLGYLYLPDLGSDNLGVRDQAAALHWVRDNVAAFGGDPDRITVGGQSAGALSALYLALAPGTHGLIRRIICQSGPFGLAPQEPAHATEMARLYLDMLGVRTETALREISTERLLKAYLALSAYTATIGNVAPPMYPVLGAAGLPQDWPSALAAGALTGIDVLLGTNADEMTFFYAYDERIRHSRRTDAIRIMAGWVGEDAEPAYELRRRPDATPWRILAEAATDHFFVAGARRIAARHDPAYVYRFERRPPGDDVLGSTHCAELPFVFGNFATFRHSPMLGPVTDADHALSREMGRAFAAFAATGAPDGEEWRPYRDGDAGRIRRFGTKSTTTTEKETA
jgi:para-nitrobenzyl esterase